MFFIPVMSYAVCEIETKQEVYSLLNDTHYVGCVDGFNNVAENGMFKRPDKLTKEDIFKIIESGCIKKTNQFINNIRKDMEGNGK